MSKEIIGNCTLYHGDCFEILREISGADAMITDPPYGCTKNAWDYDIDLDKFWKLGKAACKGNAPYIIFCIMPFSAFLYMSNRKNFRHEYIYKKPTITGYLNAAHAPLRAHELIHVYCSKNPLFNVQKKRGKPYIKKMQVVSSNYSQHEHHQTFNLSGDRFPTSILDVKHEATFYTVKPIYLRHPTQKSVAVLSHLVKTYSNKGDTIIDPFMGSGSTGVAAIKHGRKFIGIEQDKKWFDVACKRIEDEYQNNSLYNMIGGGDEKRGNRENQKIDQMALPCADQVMR